MIAAVCTKIAWWREGLWLWWVERQWRNAVLNAKWAFVTAGGDQMSDDEWTRFLNALPTIQFIALMSLGQNEEHDDMAAKHDP